MKKLRVDIEEIGISFEDNTRYNQDYYLDTETGEIIILPKELSSQLENDEPISDLPDWEQELAKVSKKILSGDKRYQRIPEKSSSESYNLMAEFITMPCANQLKEKLSLAINGKGAFRRFKDTLSLSPDIEKHWYDFKQKRLNKDVIEWLHSIGIESI
jgi:hypothetical protein